MSIFNQDPAGFVSLLRQYDDAKADSIDTFLSIGAAFDILSPILNWLQGYNTLYAGGLDYEEAILTQMSLAEQGIRARVEGIGNYRVVIK